LDWELPKHRLELPVFLIARTPVTVAQFAQFVATTGYRTTAEQQGSTNGWTGTQYEDIKGAFWRQPRGPGSDVAAKQDHPVTCVSWVDAIEFCQWATAVYGAAGQPLVVRLPSEAEWEKAARGTDGRIYPWGNQKPDQNRCNFNLHIGDTTPVQKYASYTSPYGIVDMVGNVWEWTSTKWLADYKDYANKVDNRLEGDEPRVIRGGSFHGNRQGVRCAFRDGYSPIYRDNALGFRVVSPGL
jgi:formylglycine-generating enzyme required for sulfatase activity